MGGRNQLHLEYAYAIISILSSATMWACFRLIKRHGNTPRANSYMTLSQIATGEGSGFFRFLVLRFFPPLVVLTGEAAILAKWKSSVNQQIICLSVSALLHVSLSYVPSLIRGFTFGERFLSLTLILAYPVLAFLIGAMTQCIDFSQFAPSNLQTMIDGIWQTFITAIIVIAFYELLRNYPEEKHIEQDELYDRKSQIVVLKHYYDLQFSPAVETIVKKDKKNPKRVLRDVKKQLQNNGIGTKSQQALKLQHELKKEEYKSNSKHKKQMDAEQKFKLKQQKKKAKHRGH
ncbi:MAG: YjdF family protein [Bifidobacterium catenulatum]